MMREILAVSSYDNRFRMKRLIMQRALCDERISTSCLCACELCIFD